MSFQEKTVLLIDDDPELRKIAERILSNVGMNVRHASSVSEAFSLIKNEIPHLIITDLNMKPESGFEFLLKFKAHPDSRNIPVLVLSGRSDRESINQAIALGAREYLSKPIEASLLLQKARKLIKLSSFPVAKFPLDGMPTVTMLVPGSILGGNQEMLQIESPIRLSRESLVSLDSAALAQMNFDVPPLLRSSASLPKMSARGGFLNELRFLGLLSKQVEVLKGIIARWHSR